MRNLCWQALLDAVNLAEQLVREFNPRRREQTDRHTGGQAEAEAEAENEGEGGAMAAAAEGHAALDPVAAQVVRACRAYEVEMMTRTRSKVESSFAAVRPSPPPFYTSMRVRCEMAGVNTPPWDGFTQPPPCVRVS